ncbi:MAG: DMT family transporter [Gammaproteobacteria bacterium]
MNPLVLVFASAVLMSMKGIVAKFAFAEGVALGPLLVLRALLSLPIFWVWAARRGDLARVARAPRRELAWGAFGGVLSYYVGTWLDFRGLELIAASLERALLFAYPAFVVLLRAALRRQWPGRRLLVAVGATYCGIFLAVGGLQADVFRMNAAGGLMVLASAAMFAGYLLINERVATVIGSLGYLVVAMSAASACLLLHFAITSDFSALTLSARAWALVIGLTIFTNVLPLIMMAEGVLRLGAQRAAVLGSIGPPCTLAAGWWLLDESLHATQLWGTALIVAGILVLEGSRGARR